MNEATPWWMAGSVTATLILREGIAWWAQRKSASAAENAAASLVRGLTERIVALEAKQRELENQLNEQTEARRDAEENEHKLKLRIDRLEQAMRAANVPIPAVA